MRCAPWTREKEENSKYLRKDCHHYIKCTAATFLVVLMWRRFLNSVALAATTHRRLKGVFDGIGAQMGVQVINKCKVQIIRKGLYNVEKPPIKRGEQKKDKKRIL